MPFDFPVPRRLVDLTIGSFPITPGLTSSRLFDTTLGATSTASVFGLSISGALGNATVGQPYSFVPTAAGGAPGYSFALVGSLPAGLSFSSSTGAITGTPTTAGTSAGLSITATDTKSATATIGPFSLVVAVAGAALSISGTPGNANVGDSPTFAPSISGGVAPYSLSVSSGSLPPGRSLSGLSVVGSYSTAGSYAYTLRATDSAGATADLPVFLSVSAGSGVVYLMDRDGSRLIDFDGSYLKDAA